jgi:hypothetical protein
VGGRRLWLDWHVLVRVASCIWVVILAVGMRRCWLDGVGDHFAQFRSFGQCSLGFACFVLFGRKILLRALLCQ